MYSLRSGRRDGPRGSRLRLAFLVVLAATVALAGCNAVPGSDAPESGPATVTDAGPDDTPTATATDATATATESPPSLAERGVDVNGTWNRTQRLMDLNATRPPVEVRNIPQPSPFRPSQFFTAFVGPRQDSATEPEAFYHPSSETVTVAPFAVREASPARLESTLAHEFVHAIQHEYGWLAAEAPRSARAEPNLPAAHQEGMAEYVAWEYEDRYLDISTRESDQRWYANATTHQRYGTAPYVHGPTYFENRLSGPGALATSGGDWPASWEQVLHDTEESPRALTIEYQYAADRWVVENLDRSGELVTRLVLRDELSKERATNAAAGWGSDRVRYFQSSAGNESGYLWIHRWDTVEDADEFEDAMTAFIEERRSEAEEREYEYRRLAPETTVVVTSEDGSVDMPSITADSNESVTMSFPN